MSWIETQKQSLRRSKEVLGAYFRQGLHELGNALYGPGTAAQLPEYGMAGTKTPGQVADGLRGKSDPAVSRDESPAALLDQYVQQAKERDVPEREPERDDRHIERD